MSNNRKRSLLLSPILLSMFAAGSVHAHDAAKTEGQVAPIAVKTAVTRADVEFNVQLAEQLMDAAKKASVATQCALYSVDSAGNGHCAFYDSAVKPMANAVGMTAFDV